MLCTRCTIVRKGAGRCIRAESGLATVVVLFRQVVVVPAQRLLHSIEVRQSTAARGRLPLGSAKLEGLIDKHVQHARKGGGTGAAFILPPAAPLGRGGLFGRRKLLPPRFSYMAPPLAPLTLASSLRVGPASGGLLFHKRGTGIRANKLLRSVGAAELELRRSDAEL